MGNVAVPKRKSLCKGKETFSSLYRIGLFFLAVRYLGFEGFGAPDDLSSWMSAPRTPMISSLASVITVETVMMSWPVT